jgi:hypothetical protein
MIHDILVREDGWFTQLVGVMCERGVRPARPL